MKTLGRTIGFALGLSFLGLLGQLAYAGCFQSGGGAGLACWPDNTDFSTSCCEAGTACGTCDTGIFLFDHTHFGNITGPIHVEAGVTFYTYKAQVQYIPPTGTNKKVCLEIYDSATGNTVTTAPACSDTGVATANAILSNVGHTYRLFLYAYSDDSYGSAIKRIDPFTFFTDDLTLTPTLTPSDSQFSTWHKPTAFNTVTYNMTPITNSARYSWSADNPLADGLICGAPWKNANLSNGAQVTGGTIDSTGYEGTFYLNVCDSFYDDVTGDPIVGSPQFNLHYKYLIDKTPPDNVTVSGGGNYSSTAYYGPNNPLTLSLHVQDNLSPIHSFKGTWAPDSTSVGTRIAGTATNLDVAGTKDSDLTVSITGLTDGTWYLNAVAQDQATNTGNKLSPSLPVNIDGTAPAVCMQVYLDVDGPDGAAASNPYDSCRDGGASYTAREQVSVYFKAYDVGASGISWTTYPEPTFFRDTTELDPVPNLANARQDDSVNYFWEYQNLDGGANYKYKWTAAPQDNAKNPTSKTFTLTYALPSYAPTNVRVTGTPTASQINVAWDQGVGATPASGGYRIVNTNPTDTTLDFKATSSPKTASLTTAFANFHAKLRIDGCGPSSSLSVCTSAQAGSPNPVDVWTPAAVPLPGSVPAQNVTAISADLLWGQNNNAHGNTIAPADLTKYHVRFTVPSTPPTGFTPFFSVTATDNDPMTLPVPGLTANTKYTYTVTAVSGSNGVETSPVTQTFYTDINPPAAPTAISLPRDTLSLTLQYARTSATDVQSYYLSTTDNSHQSPVQTSGTSAKISGLTPGTTYNVKTCIKPATGSTITTDKCSQDTPLVATTKFIPGLGSINSATLASDRFSLTLNNGGNGNPTGVQLSYTCSDGTTADHLLLDYSTALDVTGLKSGVICRTIQVNFGFKSDLPTFSDPLSITGVAYTKTDAPAVAPTPDPTKASLTCVGTTGIVLPTTNDPLTTYKLVIGNKAQTEIGTVAIPGSGAPAGIMVCSPAVPIQSGHEYFFKVRAIHQANNPTVVNPLLNADGPWSTTSAPSKFSAPTIALDPTQTKDNQLGLAVTPATGETPSFVQVGYTDGVSPPTLLSPYDVSSQTTIPYAVPISGLPIPSANKQYTLVKANVGSTTTPSDSSWSTFSNTLSACTRPAVPATPTVLDTHVYTNYAVATFEIPGASGANYNPTGTVYVIEACADSSCTPATNVTSITNSSYTQVTGDLGRTITLVRRGLSPGTGWFFYIHVLSLAPCTGLDAYSTTTTQLFTHFAQPATVSPTWDPAITTSNLVPIQVISPGQTMKTIEVTFVNEGVVSKISDTDVATKLWIPDATTPASKVTVLADVGPGKGDRMFSKDDISVRIGGDVATFDLTASPGRTADREGYTKPEAPGRPTYVASTVSGQIGAHFNFAANSVTPQTNYYVESFEDPGVNNPLGPAKGKSAVVKQGTPGAQTADQMISGLRAGQSYYLGVLTETSFSSLGTAFNVLSETSGPYGLPFSKPQAAMDLDPAVTTASQIVLQLNPQSSDAVPASGYAAQGLYDITFDGKTTKDVPFNSTTPLGLSDDKAGILFPITIDNKPNAEITNIRAALGSVASTNWSPQTVAIDLGPTLKKSAYTRPQKLGAPVPLPLSATASSVQFDVSQSLNGTQNPTNTTYRMELSQNQTDFTNPKFKVFSSADTLVTIDNLEAGVNYYAQIRSVDLLFNSTYADAKFDVVTTDIVSAQTTILPPVIDPVLVTTVGYTAAWQLGPAAVSNAGTLRVVVKDKLGNAYPFPTFATTNKPTVKLDLSGQTSKPSNMFYMAYLQHCLADGTGCADFANGSGGTTTYAETPLAPNLPMTGPKDNIHVAVKMLADANANDSVYSLNLAIDGGATKYLDGNGGLSLVPVFKTAAEWATGATNVYNAGPSNTDKGKALAASVSVRQKRDMITVPPVVATSDITPGNTPGGTVTVTVFSPASGTELDNYLYGALVTGPFYVRFWTDVLPATIPGNITLTQLDGTPGGTPVDIDVSNYSTDSHVVQVTPIKNLIPNMQYKLTVLKGIEDFLHIGATDNNSSQTITFVTGLDRGLDSKMSSFYDDAKANILDVPSGSLPTGSYVVMRTKLIDPPQTLASYSAARTVREIQRVEILFYNLDTKTGTPLLGNSNDKKLTLVMKPQFATTGSASAAAATGAGTVSAHDIDLSSMKIYRVQPQGLKPQDSKVNADGTVSTDDITQSGTYVLAAGITTSLDAAHPYPVPFRPADGHTNITFVNLAADTKIRIYTIAGELVKELSNPDADGKITWPVKNSKDENVASGVYIYQIKNSYSEKRGKLMVIR